MLKACARKLPVQGELYTYADAHDFSLDLSHEMVELNLTALTVFITVGTMYD